MENPLPVRLDDLISHVNQQHPDDSLEALSDAVMLADRLGEQSDHLIGHFVDQARRSGASWTDIGSHMGVSKQAAQKRFVLKPGADSELTEVGLYNRFTPRARIVVEQGQVIAREVPNGVVDTVHLLLGLLQDQRSLAGVVLVSFDVSLDGLMADARAVIPEPAEPATTSAIPFSDGARTALKLTLREALGLGHNYIGTEHLLLGLLAEGGEAARLLNARGVDKDSAKQQVQAELDKLLAAYGPKLP